MSRRKPKQGTADNTGNTPPGIEPEHTPRKTDAAATGPKRSWRRFFIIGGALLALALLTGGAALGWWAANATVIAAADTGSTEPTEDLAELVDGAFMPDVRGLSREDAEQVLADSGFTTNVITVEEAPSAAPEGTVVSQTPVFGTVDPASITLGVAVPTTMPDLVGSTRDEAVAKLSALGVSVTYTFTYGKDTAPGTVTAVSPAVGDPLATEAAVTVATRGASVDLGDVTTKVRDCNATGKVQVGGKVYANAISCGTDPKKPSATVWLTEGKVDRLTGTVGIDDESTPGVTAHVVFTINGTAVLEQNLTYGKPIAVDLPVTGSLQLGMTVTSAGQTDVVFADPVLLGAEPGINEITR